MAVATQIDKCQRDWKKCTNTKRLFMSTIIIIPFLFIMYYCIDDHEYVEMSASRNNEIEKRKSNLMYQIIRDIEYSDKIMASYNKFVAQLQISKKSPLQSAKDRVSNPMNSLFVRTKSVQYLLEYVELLTKETYWDEYEENGKNHRRVECDGSFTHGMQYEMANNELYEAVRQFVIVKRNLYGSTMKQYAERRKITKENDGGTPALIGQYGLFAKQFIRRGMCIGQYYGDEYLEHEYDALFDQESKDAFVKKHEYKMTTEYDIAWFKKLESLNISVAIDAFHLYDHGWYVRHGDIDLNEEEWKRKQNEEAFINDARNNVHSARISWQEKKKKNTEFVTCRVNGFYMTFVVAIKDIPKDQQLLIYYGPEY